ncbi:A disintegrin and metalloproteinase with thrombospondin motifs 9-like [Ostrea edulis]|uniref:A disintegrin and metalloproteinase with thrombospondin motifs 9-like n=1 Tax=Ostrea edulis TaxID=37623 RepID=UPI0024AFCAF5|nr:A disintegrin and metalloproteinase with thrombospondin motifs 9-like [Ostrea edulis]
MLCMCLMTASAGKAAFTFECQFDIKLIFHTFLFPLGEIYFRQIKTRLDLIEPSLAVWSGFADRLSQCGFICLQKGRCVSLLYSPVDNSCKLFDVIYDESGGIGDIEYYILDTGNRWIPESCVDVATCSGITTDGEYWIYPKSSQRKRIKIFCYKLRSDPSEYITLKSTNTFIQHDDTNWPSKGRQCYSSYKLPLKRADFTKVGIQIQNMEVDGTDYTFALLTGLVTVPFGHSMDCNGERQRQPCPHYGTATINTRGTGLIIDLTLTWGVTGGWRMELKDFNRSTDGAEISFTCAGWCGKCGPVSEPIKFQLSTEFISAAEARVVICKA